MFSCLLPCFLCPLLYKNENETDSVVPGSVSFCSIPEVRHLSPTIPLCADILDANTSLYLIRTINACINSPTLSSSSSASGNRKSALDQCFGTHITKWTRPIAKTVAQTFASWTSNKQMTYKDAQAILNAAADAPISGEPRPRGFTVVALIYDGEDWLSSPTCQTLLGKEHVIIYVDQEGLSVKRWTEDEAEEDVTLMYDTMRLFRTIKVNPGGGFLLRLWI